MDEEYNSLLDILLQSIESNNGVEAVPDERVLDAESLAIKLFEHSATIKYLYEGTPVRNYKNRLFDLPSLNVISRAIIENFLVFHYVYIQPKDKDEEDFRYWSYWISGLLERKKFPFESPQGKELVLKEKELIEHIITKLTSNKYFLELTKDYQEKIIKRGEWRLKTWTDVGLSANLNESNAKYFYKFLCGYAHSGNLSIRQLHQAVSHEEKIQLFSATLFMVKIAMANMIIAYSNYFPKVKVFYNSIGTKSDIVQQWVDIGSTDLKSVDVDWSKLDS